MAFVTQPLPAELLHLLVEGERALAAPPRADAGNDSEPVRHRFEAEGVDVWLTRATGGSAEPPEAGARRTSIGRPRSPRAVSRPAGCPAAPRRAPRGACGPGASGASPAAQLPTAAARGRARAATAPTRRAAPTAATGRPAAGGSRWRVATLVGCGCSSTRSWRAWSRRSRWACGTRLACGKHVPRHHSFTRRSINHSCTGAWQ